MFSCEKCPENWNCPELQHMDYRNAKYLPDAGYWTACTNPNTCTVYACPVRGNCAGGDLVNAAGSSPVCFAGIVGFHPNRTFDIDCQCKDHSYGVLCGSAMKGYQNAGNTKTPYECGPTGWLLLFYITMTIILVAFLVWKTHQEDFLDGSSPRTALLFVGLGNYQVAVVMFDSYSSVMPSWADGWLDIVILPFRVISGNGIYYGTRNLGECHTDDMFFKNVANNQLVVYLIFTVLTVLLPFLLNMAYLRLWLYWGDKWRRRNQKGELSEVTKKQQQNERNKQTARFQTTMMSASVVALFLMMPSALAYVLRYLNCTTVNGVDYLTSDVSIKCWEGTHLLFSATICVCSVFLLAVVYPLGVQWYLYSQRQEVFKRKPKSSVVQVFGLYFLPFENFYYFWGCVITLRKVVFVACMVSLEPLGSRVQSVVGFCVLNMALVYHIQHRPFYHDDVDALELLSIFGNEAILFFLIISEDMGAIGPTVAFISFISSVAFFSYKLIFFYKRNNPNSDNNDGRHGFKGSTTGAEAPGFDHKSGIMYRPRGEHGFSQEVKSFKCDYCFTVFHSDGAWDDHQSICKQLLEHKRTQELNSEITPEKEDDPANGEESETSPLSPRLTQNEAFEPSRKFASKGNAKLMNLFGNQPAAAEAAAEAEEAAPEPLDPKLAHQDRVALGSKEVVETKFGTQIRAHPQLKQKQKQMQKSEQGAELKDTEMTTAQRLKQIREDSKKNSDEFEDLRARHKLEQERRKTEEKLQTADEHVVDLDQ